MLLLHTPHTTPIRTVRTYAYVCVLCVCVYADGEWDFDNYSTVMLGQRKELPVTSLAAVNYNVWCGTGNYVHVVGGSSLKMEVSWTE